MIVSKKENKYTLIDVQEANLTSEAMDYIVEEVIKCGDNIILKTSDVENTLDTILEELEELYTKQYEQGKSFIIAELSDSILDQAEEAEIELNAVPTLAEAIDIVFLEEIERELE